MISTSKLQRRERSIYQIFVLMIEQGYKPKKIKEIWLSGQDKKEDRYQMSLLFDRIYHFIENEKKPKKD